MEGQPAPVLRSAPHLTSLALQIKILVSHPCRHKKGTDITKLRVLTPFKTTHMQLVNHISIPNLLKPNNNDIIHYRNSFLKSSRSNMVIKISSFRTPQNPGNEQEHTPIQTRTLDELRELESTRQDRLTNMVFIQLRLDVFFLIPDARQTVEALLVEFHDIFAEHRFDFGFNIEFKFQLIH